MPLTDPTAPAAPRVVLVTGPAGAGRSTAINMLEDLGFEAIDNLPLRLLPRLLDGPTPDRSLALGVDARNRDYSVPAMIEAFDSLEADGRFLPDLLYVDCAPDVLRRRYSETRRRHPLSPGSDPADGIALEREALAPVRARASILIDTSTLTPHQLSAEIARLFSPGEAGQMTVDIVSFSYRRGLPTAADLVFDVRFLRNPHWEEALRDRDGRDTAVQSHIAGDPRFPAFRDQIVALAELLLPAFREEGKTHLTIAFGCTGGQHRSVALTEILSAHLEQSGWRVSKRHREVEQRQAAAASPAAAKRG